MMQKDGAQGENVRIITLVVTNRIIASEVTKNQVLWTNYPTNITEHLPTEHMLNTQTHF